MVFYRAVNSFLIFGLIFLAISTPSSRSFHTKAVSRERKNVVRVINTKVVESSNTQREQQKSKMMSESSGNMENSAREVPTGPNPLHHNKDPIGP